MRSKKIIAAAASLAFIMQIMPVQVLAEDEPVISEETVQENDISTGLNAESEQDETANGTENSEELTDEELLQQVDELVLDFELPEVGMGFIELTPEQTEAVVRAIDEQNRESDFEINENYKASLYTFHNDYFRDQLNTEEKELYDSWVKICSEFMISTQDIEKNYPDYVLYDPTVITQDRAFQIVNYAYYSYPEFFFLNNGTVYGQYGSQYLVAPSVNDDFKTGSFRNQIYNNIVDKTESWMAEINALPDDLAKEKYIADKICNTVTYTSVTRLDQSLYGSLVLKTAVCNGYAMEMNYFCNAAGIDCITVFSDTHAWNNVKLFGDWYVVDTTWMDQKTWIWYDWFNINTETMLENDQNGSHIVDTSSYTNITLPTCTKLDPQVPVVPEITVNSENFPDTAFRTYISNNIDTDNSGGLSESEISKTTYISISGTSSKPGTISDLTGIEYFTNLISLSCSYNNISSLDLSNNTALTELFCNGNKLTSLNVSQNTALIYLWCQNNELTSLDVSKNTALTALVCSDNQLTSLDLSNNTKLTDLNFSDNISSIDIVDISYSLAELPEGFRAAKTSNWQGAEYDSTSGSLKNFTSDTVTYDYDCGNGKTASFTLKANIVIQQAPKNTTVIEGLDTTLEFKAIGTDLSYQWQKYDGTIWVNISGADSPVLALENVSSDINGNKYRCSISTSNASVTYTAVTITVRSVEEATEEDISALSAADKVRFVNLFTEKQTADCNVLTAAQLKAIEAVLENDYAA